MLVHARRGASRALRLGCAACLSVLVVASAPAGAQSPEPAGPPSAAGLSGSLLVAPGEVQTNLRPLARGAAELARLRVESLGARIVPGATTRARVASLRRASPEALAAAAKRLGAEVAVLVDLELARGHATLRLRAYDAKSGQLRGVGRGRGSPARWDELCDAASAALGAALGVRAPPRPAGGPLGAEDLSALGSALEALDAGALAFAWRELEGRPGAVPDAVRAQIRLQAKDPTSGAPERARLLAAMGQVDRAWDLLSQRAEAELERQYRSDEVLLRAAGELLLQRGEVDRARDYLEAAVQLQVNDPLLDLALGRLHARSGDLGLARRALQRAREQLPPAQQLDVTVELGRLGDGSARQRAQHWLDAADQATRTLRPTRARELLERARALEVAPDRVQRGMEELAALETDLGDADAPQTWRSLIELSGSSPDRLLSLAQSLRANGRPDEAAEVLEQAVPLAPERADVVGTLGELELEAGAPERAEPRLERALELNPRRASAARALARLRLDRGETTEALRLLRAADAVDSGGPEALVQLAVLERESGDPAAAVRALERAADLEPWDPEVRVELSRTYQASGQLDAAREHAAMAMMIGGDQYAKLLDEELTAPEEEISESVDRFVANLLESLPDVKRVSLVGVRAAPSSDPGWRRWLRPRRIDAEKVERGILGALSRSVEASVGRASSGQELYFENAVNGLYAWGEGAALDPTSIAALNGFVDSDATLIVRYRENAADPGALDRPCGIGAHLLIEGRLLVGRLPEGVSGLQSRACMQGGLERFGAWNSAAFGLYAAVLLVLLYPFLRGWGKVVVVFEIPESTRPMLSVSVTRRRRKLRADGDVRDDAKWRIKEGLQLLKHRSEKRLSGNAVAFSFLPARRSYYVTVRGPLIDRKTDELLGSFSAEKTVTVARGKASEVRFDLATKEACVEVSVVAAGTRVAEGQVCVRGDPKSVRFARGGKPAYLYLPCGTYVIVAGVEDCLAELELEIDRPVPVNAVIDVRDPGMVRFSGCADAVQPYVEGDFARAAQALEAAGLADEAASVRALLHLREGDVSAAEASFADAGDAGKAATLALERGDLGEAARRFQEAGDHAQAAESYLRQGDVRSAACAFELAYDYDRAAECYREAGDLVGLARALERSGDVFEAGRTYCALERWDAAIETLQKVETRHPNYTEACLILGELFYDRGDRDLALEQFDEAMSRASSEGLELAQHARYAELLEEGARFEEAVDVYNRIRRRDPNYPGARERVQALREKMAEAASTAQTHVQGATQGGATQPQMVEESRYEILGELGRGAMGIVYKARDRVLGRLVALKKLPESMRQHELAVKFFLREARSAAALNHSNIVTVYDAGQDDGTYFLTMECLEGTTIEDIQKKKGVLSARDTCVLGLQAAAGLAYAHSSGIIHRDIKPSNLFFTRDRVVKIMDFGLAKAVEEVRRNATVIAGTPYYMPPEQAEGGVVDHRSDLYALGVTLFHLCTGEVPYTGGDVTYHHRHTPPPDPRERVPDLPADLAELILQLMAKDPDARVQSAEEIATRLRAIASALRGS